MRPVNEARLADLARYIRERQMTDGTTPSYRDIKDALRYSSLSIVAADVARLEERGILSCGDSVSRRKISMPEKLDACRCHTASILGTVRCGQPTPSYDDIEATVSLPDEIFGTGEHVILRAKGPSMYRRGIFDGDYLVVRRDPSPPVGSTVVALLNGDETTCKILSEKNGRLYLRAANDEKDASGRRVYDVYPRGEWSVLGVVDFVIHAPMRDEIAAI